MLVLSRKIGTCIIVAGNIEIQVVQICGNSVRLGITAPRHVSIDRLEVCSMTDQYQSESNKLLSSQKVVDDCDKRVHPVTDSED